MEATRFRIGDFAFDARSGELTRDGERTRLRPQAATALQALAEQAGHLVAREDLIRRIWPEGGSEPDVGLNVSIGQVRAALGDNPDDPVYVETLRGRGYRLVAPVESLASPQDRTLMARALMAAFALVVAGAALSPLLPSDPRPARIAVLPFESVTTGPMDSLAFLRQGLAEDVITTLASTDPARLSVVARTSSFGLAASGLSPTEVGRRLEADYVLQGTLRETSPGVYRVTARLLDSAKDSYVWADQFDRGREGVVGLDDPVAAGVLATLGEVGAVPTANPRLPPGARETVLRSRYLTGQGIRQAGTRAVEELTRVVDEGVDHPAVWIEMANARLLLGQLDEAETALERAAAHGGPQPGYHLAAARVAFYGRRDPVSANRHLALAVGSDPGSGEVRHVYAQTLAAVGSLEEALEHGRVALDLDPVSASVQGDIGWVLYYGRAFGEARSRCASTLALRPDSRGALTCTILSAHFEGTLLEESHRLREAIGLLGGTDEITRTLLKDVAEGDPRPLWEWLLTAGSDAGALNFATRARLAALAGDPNQAAAVLQAAAEAGRAHLWAGVDPAFDALSPAQRKAS